MKKYKTSLMSGLAVAIVYTIGVYLSGMEISRGRSLCSVYVIGAICVGFALAFGHLSELE